MYIDYSWYWLNGFCWHTVLTKGLLTTYDFCWHSFHIFHKTCIDIRETKRFLLILYLILCSVEVGQMSFLKIDLWHKLTSINFLDWPNWACRLGVDQMTFVDTKYWWNYWVWLYDFYWLALVLISTLRIIKWLLLM